MATDDPRDKATPIQGVPIHEPIETIAHRTRATATDARATLSTMNTMAVELRAHITHDEAELRSLNGGLDELKSTVSDLQVSNARTEAVLSLIHDDVKATKQMSAHRERIALDLDATQTKLALDDAADKKKVRRATWGKAVLIIAGAIATAITTYVAATH